MSVDLSRYLSYTGYIFLENKNAFYELQMIKSSNNGNLNIPKVFKQRMTNVKPNSECALE